jgi:hypothetical protein
MNKKLTYEAEVAYLRHLVVVAGKLFQALPQAAQLDLVWPSTLLLLLRV